MHSIPDADDRAMEKQEGDSPSLKELIERVKRSRGRNPLDEPPIINEPLY